MMKVAGVAGRRSMAAVLAGLISSVGFVTYAVAQPPVEAGEVTEAQEGAIKVLVTALTGEVTRLVTASVEDIEAALMFRVSQSGVGNEDAIIALNRVRGLPDNTENVIKAIDNVIAALRKGKRLGTGAIGGGNGNDAFFASPAAAIGGGGANYRTTS